MTTIWQDIRYGFRRLRKNPGFSAIAVLSLALAIGANTAVFSLYNAAMLKPLPVRQPQQLRAFDWAGDVRVLCSGCRLGSTETGETTANVFSYPIFLALRDQVDEMAELFAFSQFDQYQPLTVRAGGEATTAEGAIVSSNFFRALGVEALIGQTLAPEHDQPGSEPVAVISHAAWKRYFGGDPEILGRTVSLNRHPFMIIGVLPRGFLGLEAGSRGDFYVPMGAQARLRPEGSLTTNDIWWVQVMARLSPGASDAQLRASLEVRLNQILSAEGLNHSERPARIVVQDGRGGPLGPRRFLGRALPILIGIAAIVLLAACANLASLLLARGVARQREMALRGALGARAWRLVRQSLVESLLIALAGAGGGFLLATWGKQVLARMLWPSWVTLDLSHDVSVLGFTLAVCLGSALLFGLLPAWRLSRTDPMTALRERASGTASIPRLGKWMVSVQTALAFLLIVGAGLFVRTLVNLDRVETGFRAENILVFSLDGSKAGLENEELTGFYEDVSSAVAALPGVQGVAHSTLLLLSGWMNTSMAQVPDRPEEDAMPILGLSVGESFLSTMGIPLLSGRDFAATDDAAGQPVVLVNDALARQAFPGQNPIGRSLGVGGRDYQIVGVFADISYVNLKRAPEPTVFYARRQQTGHAGKLYFEVRAAADPLALAPAIRAIVARIDGNIPLTDVKTQAIQIEESMAHERLLASLASGLACLAVLLSCIGLYGVMTHQVMRRTGEIGLRMALGASERRIAWLILRGALVTTAAGVIVGFPAILVGIRFVRDRLFGIAPYDPGTLVGAAILLFSVAVLAAWIPARRASRIDPMVALRYE